jgi:hypothetical protein
MKGSLAEALRISDEPGTFSRLFGFVTCGECGRECAIREQGASARAGDSQIRRRSLARRCPGIMCEGWYSISQTVGGNEARNPYRYLLGHKKGET